MIAGDWGRGKSSPNPAGRVHDAVPSSIGHPTEAEFEAIIIRVCEDKGVPFDKEVFDHLRENGYRKIGVTPNACHPRRVIEFIIDDSRYYRKYPRLIKEGITEAWNIYLWGRKNGAARMRE